MDCEQGPPMLEDILHPLSILDWKRCHPLKHTGPTCCAVLQEILCIVSRNAGFGDTLYRCSTHSWKWTTKSTKYEFSSLTTFKSDFLSIGGFDIENKTLSTEVRPLNKQLKFQPRLIPLMQSRRYRVSTVNIKIFESEYLLVAGGQDISGNHSDVVEVLVENQWIVVDSLPLPCNTMQCTLHEGCVYFLGRNAILYCKCDALHSWIKKRSSVKKERLWKHFRTDHTPITLISYGNRLVSVDEELTVRAYYDKNQCWIETISKNNDGTIVSAKAATAVIESGELILAYGDDAAYKISLSVANFTRECSFIRGSLTRLEAAMRIDIGYEIKSEITKITAFYQRTFMDKYGHTIDPVKSPLTFVEEVVFTKSSGFSEFSSTWHHFFEVLQNAGLTELSKRIESFMNDETMFEEACYHFIKQSDCLEMYFLKVIFLGPTGLGKTTTRRRLTGKIINLEEKGVAELQQSSTAVVEGKNIVITNTLLITKSNWSKELSLQDEAWILLKNIKDTLSKTSPNTTSSVTSTQFTMENESYVASASFQSDILPKQEITFLDKSLDSDSLSSFPIQEISEWFSDLKEAAKESHLKDEKCQFEIHLRMEDTGGQPELMDLLPSLTVSPGIYLLFVNLNDSLEGPFEVSYTKSGKTTSSEKSHYSVKDTILSELSSIFCLSKVKSRNLLHEEASNSDLKKILKNSKSVAYVIGTHRDKVSDEHVMQFDKKLQHILEETFFYKEDVVQYCSDDRLIFTLDNMKGGVDEISEMRQRLEEDIKRHYKKLSIPVSWLLFSISLRLKQKTKTTYDFCIKLSMHFNMSQYETKVALWFLHHHAGVLMHFPDIPELKDLVILDNQIVYDSVTRIIFETMKSNKVSKAARDKFKNEGVFSLNHILQDTVEVLGCILPLELVALLEYVHIIAEISSPQDKYFSDESQQNTYIMPCVLNNLPKGKLEDISQKAYDTNYISPIAISYECGFIPIGVFPAMIARIVGNRKNYNIQHIQDIQKNKIEFLYGKYNAEIMMIYRPSYLEILINYHPNSKIQAHEVCFGVKMATKNILQNVNSRMNYKGFEDFHFAFVCSYHPKRDHLCKINNEDSSPSTMYCMKHKKPIDMEPKHQVWFKNVLLLRAPQSIDDCPTMGYLQGLCVTETKTLHIIYTISSKWRRLGDHISLTREQLNTIEKENRGIVEDCCRDVFEFWLNMDCELTIYAKTWKNIIKILKLMQEHTLAEVLHEFFTATSIRCTFSPSALSTDNSPKKTPLGKYSSTVPVRVYSSNENPHEECPVTLNFPNGGERATTSSFLSESMDTTGVHLSNSRSTAEYAVTSDVVTDGIPSHFGTPGSQTKTNSTGSIATATAISKNSPIDTPNGEPLPIPTVTVDSLTESVHEECLPKLNLFDGSELGSVNTTGVDFSDNEYTAGFVASSDIVADGIHSHFCTSGTLSESKSVPTALLPSAKSVKSTISISSTPQMKSKDISTVKRSNIKAPKVDATDTARNDTIEEISDTSGYRFTMKNLTIIKKTDHKKQVHQLRLIEQMSPHWKKASDLLGLPPDHTTRIELNHREVESCCREVMAQWLAHADGMYNYSTTWEGLCQLLEDMELSAIAENLWLIVRPDST